MDQCHHQFARRILGHNFRFSHVQESCSKYCDSIHNRIRLVLTGVQRHINITQSRGGSTRGSTGGNESMEQHWSLKLAICVKTMGCTCYIQVENTSAYISY